MATRQGYLWKRAGTAAPAMQRVFCVLAGSTLWDYDTEEEAALGLRPRCEIDLIGVSPWDGKAKYQTYNFGFLFVSSLGTTYYAVAQSKEDLESWLSAMRVGLQAKLGSAPSEPAATDSNPPSRKDSEVCGISGQPLHRSNPKVFCSSCGGAFGQEYCSEDVPLMHFKQQTGVRVCRNCFLAQYFLNHLKLLNATLRTHLHELEQEGKPVTDKNSAKIRAFRNQSKEALLAWQLLDSNQIDGKEFSELLLADARMKDERINTQLADFQVEIKAAGDDAVTLLRYLFDFRDEGQPLKYAQVLQRLLDVAKVNLPAVDFILPQLLQIFVLMSDRGLNQVLQLEALEEFIVRICTKSSAHIALRVVWAMMGYYEDTLQLNAPAFLLARRARIIRLTLHVAAAVKGNVRETNQDILHVFTIPARAQLALIRHEWALLQACRQNLLLRPFPPMTPFRKMFGDLDGEDGRPGASPRGARSPRVASGESDRRRQAGSELASWSSVTHDLTVDGLPPARVSQRTCVLCCVTCRWSCRFPSSVATTSSGRGGGGGVGGRAGVDARGLRLLPADEVHQGADRHGREPAPHRHQPAQGDAAVDAAAHPERVPRRVLPHHPGLRAHAARHPRVRRRGRRLPQQGPRARAHLLRGAGPRSGLGRQDAEAAAHVVGGLHLGAGGGGPARQGRLPPAHEQPRP